MDKKKRIIVMVGVVLIILGVVGYLYKDDVLGILGFSSSNEVANVNDDLILPSVAAQPILPQEQSSVSQDVANAPTNDVNNAVQNLSQPTPKVNPNLARSCEGGKLDDCSQAIGQFIEMKDRTNALKLAVVACDKKDAKSCALMAKIYNETDDSKVALLSNPYIVVACEYGDLESCYSLGVKYYRGDNVANDMKQAFALFKKSCDGGKVEGCNNMAVMYNNGANGIKKNLKIAKNMFKKACDSGYKPSCENLAKIK